MARVSVRCLTPHARPDMLGMSDAQHTCEARCPTDLIASATLMPRSFGHTEQATPVGRSQPVAIADA